MKFYFYTKNRFTLVLQETHYLHYMLMKSIALISFCKLTINKCALFVLMNKSYIELSIIITDNARKTAKKLFIVLFLVYVSVDLTILAVFYYVCKISN